MALPKIPNIVKHMTVAIFKTEKSLNGNARHRFLSAFDIARSQLVKYGYLQPGSETGSSDSIKLTGAGTRKNIKHVREGRSKTAYFDRMYLQVMVAVEEQDKQGKASPGGSQPSQDRAAPREQQVEEGLKVKAFGTK